jgi:hypothetical protein
MIESGLLEETARLLCEGVLRPETPPGRAIGYRSALGGDGDGDHIADDSDDRGDGVFLYEYEVMGIWRMMIVLMMTGDNGDLATESPILSTPVAVP